MIFDPADRSFAFEYPGGTYIVPMADFFKALLLPENVPADSHFTFKFELNVCNMCGSVWLDGLADPVLWHYDGGLDNQIDETLDPSFLPDSLFREFHTSDCKLAAADGVPGSVDGLLFVPGDRSSVDAALSSLSDSLLMVEHALINGAGAEAAANEVAYLLDAMRDVLDLPSYNPVDHVHLGVVSALTAELPASMRPRVFSDLPGKLGADSLDVERYLFEVWRRPLDAKSVYHFEVTFRLWYLTLLQGS